MARRKGNVARHQRQPQHASLRLYEFEEVVALASTGDDTGALVRTVTPSNARKVYICPGCQQEIRPATRHVLVVPKDAPDLRRHWHTPCWLMRERRRPGH